MAFIGMADAGKCVGVTREAARRALRRAGVNLVQIGAKTLAVADTDLDAFLKNRGDYSGKGRPRQRGDD